MKFEINLQKSLKTVAAATMVSALCAQAAFAEVKIASSTDMMASPLPDASAMLEIESSTKGVLLPRMTSSERDAISNPAEGLVVFNEDDNCMQEQRLAVGETYTTNKADGSELVYSYPWWECFGWTDPAVPQPLAASTLILKEDFNVPRENAYNTIPWVVNTDNLGIMNDDGSFTPKKDGWYAFDGVVSLDYKAGINFTANYDIFVIGETATINVFDATRPFIHRQNIYYTARHEAVTALTAIGNTTEAEAQKKLRYRTEFYVNTTVFLEAGKTYGTAYFTYFTFDGGVDLVAVHSGYTGTGHVTRMAIEYVADPS